MKTLTSHLTKPQAFQRSVWILSLSTTLTRSFICNAINKSSETPQPRFQVPFIELWHLIHLNHECLGQSEESCCNGGAKAQSRHMELSLPVRINKA